MDQEFVIVDRDAEDFSLELYRGKWGVLTIFKGLSEWLTEDNGDICRYDSVTEAQVAAKEYLEMQKLGPGQSRDDYYAWLNDGSFIPLSCLLDAIPMPVGS